MRYSVSITPRAEPLALHYKVPPSLPASYSSPRGAGLRGLFHDIHFISSSAGTIGIAVAA